MHYQTLNLSNIKFFAHKKGVTLSELASKIGMTYVGLSKLIRENTTTLATLGRLSDALDVPVQFFFMSEEDAVKFYDFSLEKFQELRIENDALKTEITELKDKIIRLADKI